MTSSICILNTLPVFIAGTLNRYLHLLISNHVFHFFSTVEVEIDKLMHCFMNISSELLFEVALSTIAFEYCSSVNDFSEAMTVVESMNLA